MTYCRRKKTCDVIVTLTVKCNEGEFSLAPKNCYHDNAMINLLIGVEMVYVHIIVTLTVVLLQ